MEKLVAAGRYADDTIMISRWLCCDCLRLMVTTCYAKQVAFKPSDEGVAISTCALMKVLDFQLRVKWDGLVVSLDAPNEIFSWYGSFGAVKKKVRFPTYDGPKKTN